MVEGLKVASDGQGGLRLFNGCYLAEKERRSNKGKQTFKACIQKFYYADSPISSESIAVCLQTEDKEPSEESKRLPKDMWNKVWDCYNHRMGG
jgi:hypothetical protein